MREGREGGGRRRREQGWFSGARNSRSGSVTASGRSSGSALGRRWRGQPGPIEAVPPPAVPSHQGAQALTHLISKAPAPMPGSSRGTPHEKARLLWPL